MHGGYEGSSSLASGLAVFVDRGMVGDVKAKRVMERGEIGRRKKGKRVRVSEGKIFKAIGILPKAVEALVLY